MLSRPGKTHATSEEITMRHALVPVHLIQQARSAVTPARAAIDAEPDEPSRRHRRARRLATRIRRARA
jgi:hypothetical protein